MASLLDGFAARWLRSFEVASRPNGRLRVLRHRI
jgi:hypothetical protein